MEDGFSLEHSTVGIVGLGLMGGSLAMRLKGKCACLIGFDTHRTTLELALSKNIIDHAEALALSGALAQSKRLDVLVLATPVPTIIDILQRLPSLITHPCIVMDIGSTKRDILRAMSALPANFDPIGGHPICGKEKLGLENADANLYQDAPFIITPLERTTRYAIRVADEIVSLVGARPIEMTAEEHDRILAATSHLPFLLSSALVNSIPQEFASLIGPGFRSTARLAGTPSRMMMGILQSNRDNASSEIQTFRASLDEIESALKDENYTKLENILNGSRNSYLALTADH
jgi:prephenate dehydrogenase